MTGEYSKKQVYSWCLYDWANSAFATTVMAGFFPVFFKEFCNEGVDAQLSTFRLGIGNAVASLVVAFTAPALGAIADRGSAKKRFLAVFILIGSVSTAGLFFVQAGQWMLALVLYAVAIFGFSGGNSFYDALLITPSPRIPTN